MKKETKDKLEELQALEQNINTILAQRQQFQSQELEVENALTEMEGKGKVYRIIGNIMVESDKSEVKKSLQEKKEILELRLKTLNKQEEKLKEKAQSLQQEVIKQV